MPFKKKVVVRNLEHELRRQRQKQSYISSIYDNKVKNHRNKTKATKSDSPYVQKEHGNTAMGALYKVKKFSLHGQARSGKSCFKSSFVVIMEVLVKYIILF